MATPTTLPSTFVAGNVLTAAEMNALRGAFRILQVVRATDTTNRTTTSSSFVDANISVTITPTATTSNIMLLWSAHVDAQAGTQANGSFAITDASNNLIDGSGNVSTGIASAVRSLFRSNVVCFDSPATTSATTYKARFQANAGATIVLNNATVTGQLFALEISA